MPTNASPKRPSAAVPGSRPDCCAIYRVLDRISNSRDANREDLIDIHEAGGPFLEDLIVGTVYRSDIGRTVTETDNLLFTCLTMNSNQIHFNREYADGTRFGQILVNSTFTLALVTGLSVAGTSKNAIANLEWEKVQLPNPVYIGDTLWAESEVLGQRESRSQPNAGIVWVRTRGINQHGDVVIEFIRTFMVPKRDSPLAGARFPLPTTPWRVGGD